MSLQELVVGLSNPYHDIPRSEPLERFKHIGDSELEMAIDFSVKNKIFPLFYEGCVRHGIPLPKRAGILYNSYLKRREAQYEAVRLLVEIAERHKVDFVVFKTFKPFNYIPDDVDILLRNESDLNVLIGELRKHGFSLLTIGTPEVVMRKVGGGAYVDLDIHTRLAVGHLDLFDVESIWREKAYEFLDLGDGYKVAKLSEGYELVREAAYNLLKDFNLSIAGLFYAIYIYTMRRYVAEIAERIARRHSLSSSMISYRLFGKGLIESKNSESLVARLVRADLGRRLAIPYPYPPPAIVAAYISKVFGDTRKTRSLKPLMQFIKQPSSKGAGLLLNYLSSRL